MVRQFVPVSGLRRRLGDGHVVISGEVEVWHGNADRFPRRLGPRALELDQRPCKVRIMDSSRFCSVHPKTSVCGIVACWTCWTPLIGH